MLRQDIHCGVYVANWWEPPDARLVDELDFTVEGETEEDLARAADQKLSELSQDLSDVKYIDDIEWGDPYEVREDGQGR